MPLGREQFRGHPGHALEGRIRVLVGCLGRAQALEVGARILDVAHPRGGQRPHREQLRRQELRACQLLIEAVQAGHDLARRAETVGDHAAEVLVPGVEVRKVRAQGEAVVGGR
ncbi:MAG TPA: hypothetical protein VN805_04355 [Caulobacteraceae bacterium]|nr:hypothetical protein [Caulobacteraceae bacterium]